MRNHILLAGLAAVICLLAMPLLAGNQPHDHQHESHHGGEDHGYAEKRREHGAHVHGLATLQLAIEGQSVAVEMETPAMNVIGFEHAPASPEQEAKLADAVKTLGDSNKVLLFKGWDCEQVGADVHPPYQPHGRSEQAPDQAGGHSDFRLNYQLKCVKSSPLGSVEIAIFKYFPGFDKINVQWISETGQGGQQVGKKDPLIRLK